MKSTAHLQGHPLHPVLIPYPFALLTSATGFDVAASISDRHDGHSHTARQIARVGLGAALIAALPGIIDYFGTVPRGSRAHRTATTHALLNVSALTCFAIAESQRDERDRMSGTGLALSLIATSVLSYSGWLGGKLIYHETIGVDEERAGVVHMPRGADPAAAGNHALNASAVSNLR